MIVWALFDSGNGCYTQGAELFNQLVSQSVNIYPIGMDIECKTITLSILIWLIMVVCLAITSYLMSLINCQNLI